MTNKTDIYDKKRSTYMTKETYKYDKRLLHACQMRLTDMTKESYTCEDDSYLLALRSATWASVCILLLSSQIDE